MNVEKETVQVTKQSLKVPLKKNEIEINSNFPPSTSTKNQLKNAHSAESNCGQYILKEYMKNVKKSFVNLFFRMENEENCIGCQNKEFPLEPVDFYTNLSKFKLFKSATQVNKQSLGKSNIIYDRVLNDSPREGAIENQFKSTNIKTFISKNHEETIVNIY